ncbi:MAG: hypothetical protein A3K10_15595 [Bacteroidetes bacterium RIFCSPLOWO2_12_FULL_31_6]|nr:MAG: hypothetical protein A3K10_15595 [Bacteroidetes bacterium RIFCSPLOWO2_12_FULL_31_6]
MKTKYFIIGFLITFIATSQNISLNTGMYHYNGDLKPTTKVNSVSNWLWGYGLSVGKQFNNGLELNIGFDLFKVGLNEVKLDSNKNFRSDVKSISGSVLYHLNMRKSTKLTPYVGFGFGTILFSGSNDLTDKNGETYNYWNDGSIRNEVESYENTFTSKKLKRDYDFETKTTEGNSLLVKAIVGVDLKTGNKTAFGINAAYNYTMTDELDNIASGGDDAYLYTGVSFKYFFDKKTSLQERNKPYKGVDYNEIRYGDVDQDKVKDWTDIEQNTPKNAKVKGNGKAVDSDKDGVPDFFDLEPNTPDTAFADANGITITDEQFYIYYLLFISDIYPVSEFYVKNFHKIPAKYRDEIGKMALIETQKREFKTDNEAIKKELNTLRIKMDNEKEIKTFKSGI